MEAAYIGYLLFVVPGFCLVWTYRHFTKAPKLGEFEFAVWSLFFGAINFLIVMFAAGAMGAELPDIPLGNLAAAIGGFLGVGLSISVVCSFPVGFMLAVVAKCGYFKKFDNALFKSLTWLARK